MTFRSIAQIVDFWHTNARGLRGLRNAGLRIVAREFAISRLRPPSSPSFVGGVRICARSGAEFTPRKLRGP
eukprot:13530768-Alexandrium_andersonii.AAC.1